jgi:hypothetical protein
LSGLVGPGGGDSSLLTGLEAFWKLGEASGTREDSAESNDLTDNNTVGQAAGKVGDAAQFVSANSEYLSVNAVLTPSGSSRTVSLWVYFDTFGQAKFASTGNTPTSGSPLWILGESGDATRHLVLFHGAGFLADGATTLTTSTWYHVLYTFNHTNNSVKVYLNGAEEISATEADNGGETGSFYLGVGFGGAQYHDGRIDAAGVWSRVVTAQEISDLYNSGNGREHPFA